MNASPRVSIVAILTLLVSTGAGSPTQAQHSEAHHPQNETASSPTEPSVLQAPGQAVFGTVQEAIRALEADSTTDWSEVDVERLRRHLIDMHHVALHVRVKQKTPIDNGVRLRVRPTNEAARASLERVLDAHPHMLEQETGWAMAVEEKDAAYVLRVTTDDPNEVAKIRALGYIGLLVYGQHHQRHHWHLLRGKHPHKQGSH